jgi:outer membrane protein OmpA-like peptidoglycan-associated protein
MVILFVGCYRKRKYQTEKKMPLIIRTLIMTASAAALMLPIQCNRHVSATGSVLGKSAPKTVNRIKLDPIYFDYYKTVLTPEAMSQLYKVGALLKSNEHYTLVIEGHSDDGASRPYEKWLAAERAKEIYNWLVRYGTFAIKQNRVIIKTAGDEREAHAACGSDKGCHAKNRRVDLTATSP